MNKKQFLLLQKSMNKVNLHKLYLNFYFINFVIIFVSFNLDKYINIVFRIKSKKF